MDWARRLQLHQITLTQLVNKGCPLPAIIDMLKKYESKATPLYVRRMEDIRDEKATTAAFGE
jgi:hypothetical protein